MRNDDNSVSGTQAHQIKVEDSEQSELTTSEENRRKAFRKIGRYSAYVAPAMLAIFSTQAHASA